MTEETNSIEQNAAADALTVDEVVGKVRAFVGTLLNGGAESPDITFGLAYVATEFGLAVAEESVQVFPVVLSAVTSAAANHKSQTEGTEASSSEVSNSQNGKPNSATLH
jgi:hypothetical protein